MEQIFQHSITAFLSSLTMWMFSRRKNLAEDRGKELDNAVKAVKYYRELLDDMAKRLAEATEALMKLEQKHHDLMRVNQSLVSELQKYKQLNGKL
ncbi:hypothetical protein BWK59_05825 [Flavobacterium davisii]|uniref:Cell wall anchor protein n=1 Tax=Flavobacterium davisii TaxID=2906077 RepID=A0A2D0AIJ6_9FLAO|nr:cell wall anchor protein [Flavobacterium davisii]OWP84341.1 hypothetical protein BWK59_05825 [Flavobacterium davisii]